MMSLSPCSKNWSDFSVWSIYLLKINALSRMASSQNRARRCRAATPTLGETVYNYQKMGFVSVKDACPQLQASK